MMLDIKEKVAGVDLKKLLELANAKPILACETDGFILKAAIASKKADSIEIVAIGESKATNFKEAVADILAQAQQQKLALPKQAILVSPSVVPALLDLPVDPEKPRADKEMFELVRWEMEPLLAQQIGIWSIGAILLGRGNICENQRQEIALKAKTAGIRAGVRFGELAVELDFVSRQEIDEALELQVLLQEVGQEIECAWCLGATEDEQQPPVWLASAVSCGVRDRWATAFDSNGVSLNWMYPIIGASTLALSGEALGEPVLEIHQNQVACITANEKGISGLRMVTFAGDTLAVSDCIEVSHELMRHHMKTIWADGLVADKSDVLQQLEERLERNLSVLVSPTAGVSAALAGAVERVFVNAKNEFIAPVRAKPPAPPIYKQPRNIVIFIVTLLFLLPLGSELSFYLTRDEKMQEEAALIQKLAKIESASQLIGGKNASAKTAQQRLDMIESKLVGAEKGSAVLQFSWSARQQFVEGLLNRLETSVNEDVVIDSVDESEKNGVFIRAWSLSEESAQQFIQKMAMPINGWSLTVEDQSVQFASGRLGLDGFTVMLHLRPNNKQNKGDG